jgi:hypothetical protein
MLRYRVDLSGTYYESFIIEADDEQDAVNKVCRDGEGRKCRQDLDPNTPTAYLVGSDNEPLVVMPEGRLIVEGK